MKRKRYSVEQIVAAVKLHEQGTVNGNIKVTPLRPDSAR